VLKQSEFAFFGALILGFTLWNELAPKREAKKSKE
jgi:hypothetical protein